MATAITGSTEDRGAVSVSISAEAPGMPTAVAEISGMSTEMKISLKHLWNVWVSSDAKFTMTENTVMAEDCSLTSIMAGGSGVAAIL